jgi:hypothetical protein
MFMVSAAMVLWPRKLAWMQARKPECREVAHVQQMLTLAMRKEGSALC